MPLTKAMLNVLRKMNDAEVADNLEDAEIVCDGNACWLGLDRIARKTVDGLLCFVAITLEEMGVKVERYTLNGTGKMLLRHPEKADEVMAATLIRDRAACEAFSVYTERLDSDGN